MAENFAHLHVHTDYSALDGAARVDALVDRVSDLEQPAVAITDHGSMAGTLELHRKATDAGITPILGTEAYLTPTLKPRQDASPTFLGPVDEKGKPVNPGDDVSGQGAYTHMTMLAASQEGLRNLFHISSGAHESGQYRKPRCLLPGQEIMTKGGMKPIEDIRVGDEVLTHEGRFRPVVETMQNWHAGDIYGVVLNNQYRRVTWMTDEHPVLIRDRAGELRWVDAKDIAAGRPSRAESLSNWNSYACLPRYASDVPTITSIDIADLVTQWTPVGGSTNRWMKPVPRTGMGPTNHFADMQRLIPLDADFGYLLGLYLSEGSVDRDQTVAFALHEDETHLVSELTRIIKLLTGREPRVNSRPDRGDGYHGISVEIGHQILAQTLKSLCSTGAANKHMPDFVFDAPAVFAEAIFRGVLDGDGSKTRKNVITLEQTSEMLFWQLRTIAARLRGDFASQGLVPLKSENHNQSYRTSFSPHPEHDTRTSIKTLSDEKYVYRPIAEVQTKHYEGWVYNIEVAEDHSYVSDFAMHNCDRDLLATYGSGIIATTGCPSGEIQTLLRLGKKEDAYRVAAEMRDLLDKGNFYVEVMDHGLEIEDRVVADLLALSKDLGLPLLATNDLHYVAEKDARWHEAMLALQSGAKLADPTYDEGGKRFAFSGSGYYVKTAEEMRALFADIPEACDNTLLVAQQVADAGIEFHPADLMPRYETPEGITEEEEFRRQVHEGLNARFGGDHVRGDYRTRAEYEMDIICEMGFPGYFLVVADFIQWAKDNGIAVGPGRGSVGGSIVAWAMRITEVDPIRHDLLFERFLNPERVSMPDIDIDFQDDRRHEVIEYVTEKYGDDRVVNIATYQKVKAKMALRDAARVLGHDYATGDKLSKAYPDPVMGKELSFADAMDPDNSRYAEAEQFRDMITDPKNKTIYSLASRFEGVMRGYGMHAAGVIISSEPVADYVPLMRAKTDGPLMTSYDYPMCESLGLVKMDFLGLSNMSTIALALKYIKANRGVDIDLNAVMDDLNDDATFDLLRRGDTVGVFQLEGTGMRALLKRMEPTCFEDISAVSALYRPGPMGANAHNDYADRKNGRKPVNPIHSEFARSLDDILGETYHVICYQEQVMRIAQEVAGYSLGQADILRKAMGKKKKDVLDKEFVTFMEGAKANGYSEKAVKTLWNILVPFADYAFNKSHSAAYGLISYVTAYLKANYPTEYMAALLSTNATKPEKLTVYLSEARAMGVPVVVPDVNESIDDYAPAGDKIRVGLLGIRGVGENPVAALVEEREVNGPYTSFVDFLERHNGTPAGNKRVVEALIQAGAFDSLGQHRAQLLAAAGPALQSMSKARTKARAKAKKAGNMFTTSSIEAPALEVPAAAEWPKRKRLALEREMLGMYVSGHPLDGLSDALNEISDTRLVDLLEADENFETAKVQIAGLITAVEHKTAKSSGKPWALVTVEDATGSMQIPVFSFAYSKNKDYLVVDTIVAIEGRARWDKEESMVRLSVEAVSKPDLRAAAVRAAKNRPYQVTVSQQAFDERRDDLKAVLEAHPGKWAVTLDVVAGDGTITRYPVNLTVTPTEALARELRPFAA